MSRLVRTVAAAAVTATSLFTIDAATTGAMTGSPSAFVAQIDNLRAARGLPALGINASLAGVAQEWAAHLAAIGALSHNPNLGSQVPAGWRLVEENVGMGSNDAIIESSFAASPDHYGNIVNPGVDEVGVGVVASGPYLWVVEDFWGGAPASGPSPSPPAPPAPLPGGGGGAPPGRPGGSNPGGQTTSSGPTGSTGSTARGGVSAGARGPLSSSSSSSSSSGPDGRSTGRAAAPPAPSLTAPAGIGPVANLNEVANQVQYLDTFD
jgi:hypothetical protein